MWNEYQKYYRQVLFTIFFKEICCCISPLFWFYWGGRNWEEGLMGALHKFGYVPRNFNCWDILQVFLKSKTIADAWETTWLCLFAFVKIAYCWIGTFPFCLLCAKLLMMPFFAICPRASLKIHEWTNWAAILWGTGAIVCPRRLALKISLRILEKEHLQQSVREQLGRAHTMG